jgi:multidrug efflux system membrane fusion protein
MILVRFPRTVMRTLQFHRTLLVGLVLLSLAGACSKKQEQRGRPAVPVVVARVKKAAVPYTIEANGVVIPYQSSTVASQVEGIVRRVAFQEGQDVVKGQVLFEIDPRPYQAQYKMAAANLARSRATAENAQREAQRYATLAQQDYVTREQAEQQQATAAASNATVAADQAAVDAARFNLENTTIRAPISGRTGALLVREGNLVHASGTTPMVVINQISPILVRFAIPSTQLPLLQRYGSVGGLVVTATPNSGEPVAEQAAGPIGLSVGGSDPGQGAAGAGQGGPPSASGASGTIGGPGGSGATGGAAPPTPSLTPIAQPENGSLSFIDNAVDTTTGTVLLKASFPNPNKRLWVGEFVAAQLALFVEQNALVVPAPAVVTGQQGTYVYVVTDSSTAQQRPVRVERTAGDLTVIASGLREGEQIVTDGQARLTPNAKVVLNTPQGAPAGRQGAGGRRAGAGGGGRGAGAGRAGGGGPGAPGAGGAARGAPPSP